MRARALIAGVAWLAAVAACAGTAGAQIVDVPPFVVDTGLASTGPAVAVGSDGIVTFIWSEEITSNSRGAFVRQFHADGTPLGPEQRVDDTGRATWVALAADPEGGYIASWIHVLPSGPLTAYGRWLNAAGQPVGQSFVVGSASTAATAVATLSTGAVFFWHGLGEQFLRLFDRHGMPRGDKVSLGPSYIYADVAAHPTGFVIAWWGSVLGDNFARLYDVNGVPLGDRFVVGDLAPAAVAVAADGDFVVAGPADGNTAQPNAIAYRRFDPAGTPLGTEVVVAPGAPRDYPQLDVATDVQGNVFVAWTPYNLDTGFGRPQARAYGVDDAPLGPSFELYSTNAYSISLGRTPDGRFVSTWHAGFDWANVVSLCTPGVAVCGDGTLHPQCEQCDDGVGNSDSTPDACRADCTLPRCGDGVVDGGEECDDANHTSCDGCSSHCLLEPGLACGDGIPNPACGQYCDDGNATAGDGCAPGCTLERIPGGGAAASDCLVEWQVNNPANEPRYDKKGAISRLQRCVDGDPRCDADGGVPDSCTFLVRVCANDTELPACRPGSRLFSWELRTPSAAKAAGNPALAAIRGAFASVVPGMIVGPSETNLCSADVAVTVPLKSGRRENKLKLGDRAVLYDGTHDQDNLTLVCSPAP